MCHQERQERCLRRLRHLVQAKPAVQGFGRVMGWDWRVVGWALLVVGWALQLEMGWALLLVMGWALLLVTGWAPLLVMGLASLLGMERGIGEMGLMAPACVRQQASARCSADCRLHVISELPKAAADDTEDVGH